MKMVVALAALALTLTTGFTCSKSTPTEQPAAQAPATEQPAAPAADAAAPAAAPAEGQAAPAPETK